MHAWATVDLDAIRSNVESLCRLAGDASVMAVVKADGYGHGMLPAARAALAGGARWLGVAFAEEALQLRAGGVTAPLLAWLAPPGAPFDALLCADVDVAAYALWQVGEIAAAARRTGR